MRHAAADAAELFLRGFHRRHPGLTPIALARGTSYAALADPVTPTETVLDLGCGDGHLLAVLAARGVPPRQLIGLDLSEAELAAAAARATGALLIQARGQALPLAAGSVDRVVSHLAFMLMTGAGQVIDELARVLRPGGGFAAVVGGGPRGDAPDAPDAFRDFVALAAPAIRAAEVPPLGERRARTADGLAGLLAAPTWRDLAFAELPIDLSGGPDEVWALVTAQYQLADQPTAVLAALRRTFDAAAPRWRRADGRLTCTMATTLVTVTRA